MFWFLFSLKPAEHTISALMGAFLEEYLVKDLVNLEIGNFTQNPPLCPCSEGT